MTKKRWVIKLGTGILTRSDGRLDPKQFTQLTNQVAILRQKGYEIVLVTSGAIGAGMQPMGLIKRPKLLHELQACATVGQISLMAEYQKRLTKHGLQGAQLLLTYWDLDSRSCYENAKQTLEFLLRRKKFVPIINENDAISGEEIKVGDNDKLSAYVAVMIEAEKLIILSDVNGFLENGKVVSRIETMDESLFQLATGSNNERSVGGMITKLEAARIVNRHGIEMIIANGRNPSILKDILCDKFVGSRFMVNRKSFKK